MKVGRKEELKVDLQDELWAFLPDFSDIATRINAQDQEKKSSHFSLFLADVDQKDCAWSKRTPQLHESRF